MCYVKFTNVRTFLKGSRVYQKHEKTTLKNVPLINSQCVKYARIQVFTDPPFPV